jgi:hypothetical protein
MASLGSTTAGALLEGALLTTSIITPSSQDVGGAIPYAALTESSNESWSCFDISQGCLLEEVAAEPLVI